MRLNPPDLCDTSQHWQLLWESDALVKCFTVLCKLKTLNGKSEKKVVHSEEVEGEYRYSDIVAHTVVDGLACFK